MGFASGFQVGAQAVERGLKMREENEQRERIKAAMGLTPQAMEQRQATPEELGRAQTYTQGLAAQDAAEFDLTPQEQGMYAPQMPVEGQRIGATQYGLGGQTFNRMPTQQEIESARYSAAANVLAERDPIAAQRLRRDLQLARQQDELYPLQKQQLEGALAGQAQQQTLTDLQLKGLKRTEEKATSFDTAFAKINATKYDKPEEKSAAVLAAVAQFKGPEAAAALEANYSTNERNKILTEGSKFDQTIKQARLKGPAAALKAIDDLNDSFTLEIDGFKVTQVNKDGTRVPFLSARNADEFALSVDSRIKEGGAFELAKFRQDEESKKALVGYYNAKAREAGAAGSAAANQLSGVQVGYSRDEKGNPIQVMSALRFNRKTGDLESVQVKLDQNVVPAAALDPKKINDAAEQLVGTPVDPTNKKGPQHTFQTARQAVTDQIFNQYLGTGGPAGGLDLSPAAIAEKMLSSQANPPAASAQKTGLTSAAPPTVPTERPVRREGESFTDFRNRTIAWDRNRMAFDEQLTEDDLRRRLSGNATGLMTRPLMQ